MFYGLAAAFNFLTLSSSATIASQRDWRGLLNPLCITRISIWNIRALRRASREDFM